MKNNWNIKISENEKFKAFNVSVENNGEYIGAIKGFVNTFDKAVEAGKDIVLSKIIRDKFRINSAGEAQKLFVEKYLFNLKGLYGVTIMKNANGEPHLEVSMNTNDEQLMKLIPDSITTKGTREEIKIKKAHGEPIIAYNTTQ